MWLSVTESITIREAEVFNHWKLVSLSVKTFMRKVNGLSNGTLKEILDMDNKSRH